MSSYAALLENYLEEEKYANDTFSSISSCLESLTSFVNEEVNFEMTISLTEAEDGIKEKDKKVSSAIKKGISTLIQKLEAFISKISEAVKRFIAKAKITISQCGNEALKKMISNNKFVIGKDIKVKTISFNGKNGSKLVDFIYTEALKAAGDIYVSAQKAAQDIADGATSISTPRNKDILDALCVDIAGSEVSKVEEIKAADKKAVKDVYNEYVGCYLDSVKTHLSAVESTCKDAQAKCKEIIKALKKVENGEKVNADAIAAVSGMSGDAMKISTYIVNYSMSILTLATKNGAKLALAAVDATGKAAATAVKGKASEVGKAVSNSKAGAAANKAMLGAEEKIGGAKAGKDEEK